jgi:hypothetical protein
MVVPPNTKIHRIPFFPPLTTLQSPDIQVLHRPSIHHHLPLESIHPNQHLIYFLLVQIPHSFLSTFLFMVHVYAP